jgi:hypothetical protein
MRPQQKSFLYRLVVLMSAMGSSLLLSAAIAMADQKGDQRATGTEFFITAGTGTATSFPARNQSFLCLAFLPLSPADINLTATTTPWVQGNKVISSQIPFVEGSVDWNKVPGAHPEFRTWVEGGLRRFKGNGIPNHPTGVFAVQEGTAAYPYYAAAPAQGYSSAAAIPIAPYDLDVTVPANPVYSETPGCISDLMFGVVTQTGAVWHANIAYAGVWVDPIAALPHDKCWGHPYSQQYHYHGYSWKCFPNQGDAEKHSPLFGYALDGFGIYGPRGDEGKLLRNTDLDECHGHVGRIEWDGKWKTMYHYHLNNEYPYGPGCYRGKPGTAVSHGDHTHGYPAAKSVDPAAATDIYGNKLQ